jgi:hypothetical protein
VQPGQALIDSFSDDQNIIPTIMKILESQSTFELVVLLTDIEALLYGEAFRTQTPVSIPELEDKKFILKEMKPHEGEDAPENSWRLVVKQETSEHFTDQDDE